MPKVSVIIPVYGVEKYIERCARSLFEQTLDDIEYLFIDDCTPDKSVEVLKQVMEDYPQREPQVTIHSMEQNSGQAMVREWGMKNVSGEFVIHCDSDDWVDSDMYALMYDKAVSEDADIVICDYYKSDGKNHKVVRMGVESSSKEELINNLLCHKLQPAVWNKLVKRSCYTSKVVFPTNNMAEDLALMVQLFYFSSKIAYINKPFYYYYFNQTSITGSTSFDNVFKRVVQYQNNVCFIEKFLSEKEDRRIFQNGMRHLKFSVKNELCKSEYDQRFNEIWKSLFPELSLLDVILLKNSKFKAKLLYIASFFGLYGYYNRYFK